MAVLNTGLAKTSAGGYTIDYSCRFNQADDASLSKTWGGAPTSGQKYTVSVWIKLCKGEVFRYFTPIYSTGGGSDDYDLISIYDDNTDSGTNTFRIIWEEGGASDNRRSYRVFRDPSAWYHCVFAWDSTQGTAADKLKVYVNNELITSWRADISEGGDPASDQTFRWNANGETCSIGRRVLTAGAVFDGYMAEFHNIDGQQLTPSSFGETGDYGEWKPLEYEGTYGDNGFYLDFADSSALGNDVSGNNNDFTANNLVASDQMLDSPTNNFCTFNPQLKHFGKTQDPTEGALKLVNGSVRVGATHLLGSTMAVTTGKWYWEIMLGDTTYSHWSKIGIASDIQKEFTELFGNLSETAGAPWAGPYGWGYGCNNAQKMHGGESSATMSGGTSFASDASSLDVMAIAIDMDAGKIWFAENNTWLDSGDPAAGSNPAWDDVSGPTVACVSTQDGTTAFVTANFGQDSSFAGEKTAQGNQDGNGIGDFYYTPPSGFLAMCTSNLPTPAVIPSEHFDVVSYTGDDESTQVVTTTFEPDFIWSKIKNQSMTHRIFDRVRGLTKSLYTNNLNAENAAQDYGYPTATSSTSVTVGQGTDSSNIINADGYEGMLFNWKANGAGSANADGNMAETVTVSANVDAGFSIVTYTGDGSAGTVGHGLSKAPEFIIVKNRDSSEHWLIFHNSVNDVTDPETDRLLMNTNVAADDSIYWNDTAPTSSVFTVGTSGMANTDDDTYVAYCWHSVDGYSKFGMYMGNNDADGPVIMCGFRPKLVIIKITYTGGNDNWYIHDTEREPYNPSDTILKWDNTIAESTSATGYVIDILSNGFKVRSTDGSHNAVQGSGGYYVYMAWAETPFKYANAR